MTTIAFFAQGIPAPGGSKRGFVVNGRAVITDDCKRNKSWRSTVAEAALAAWSGPPLDEPLAVRFEFVSLRPRGHFGTGKNARTVRASAPAHPAVKPDVLKLSRSTEDALTGILWRDDCLTIDLHVTKRYGEKPGCLVVVRPLSEAPLPADCDPPPDWPRQVGRSAEEDDFRLLGAGQI